MRNILLLLLLAISTMIQAQQCIQGDCSNGYGVVRIDTNKVVGATYLVGNFKNGKLEGEAMEVTYDKPKYFNSTKQYTEVDFLLLTQFSKPTLKDVLALKPQRVKHGNFVNGSLNGKGSLVAVEVNMVPEFEWIIQFGKTMLKQFDWHEFRYEGEFTNSKPSGRGQVNLRLWEAKLTTTGENLSSPDNPDVVFEFEKKNVTGKGLFRGSFKNGFAHGWALTNMDRDKIIPDGKMARQYWHSGRYYDPQKAGAYPGDIAGTVEYKPDAQHHYIVPLDNDGKPTNFGRLTKKNTAGQVEYVYTGYFSAGKKMGAGFLEFPNGGYRLGDFDGDTLVSGTTALISPDGVKFYSASAGTILMPDGQIKEGYGTYSWYKSFRDFAMGVKAEMYYAGNWTNGQYNGEGFMQTKTTESSGVWYYGNLAQGNTTVDYSKLQQGNIVVINGMASPVKMDPKTHRWVTADDRYIPDGTVTLSRLPMSQFFGACAMCNGSGKQSEQHYVARKSTLDVKNVTTYTDASYVGGYWKNTSKVVTETVTGGYNQTIYKTCSSCYGNKRQQNIKSRPEPK